jgi:hypothetical protein
MATIDDAITSKAMEPYALPDWETRLPIRSLWVAGEFWDLFDAVPELHDEKLAQGRRTLGEHIEQIFCDFRCAPRPAPSELRRMMPTNKGVWKLHPAGTRVYGWCPRPHSFVAVTLAIAQATKDDKSLNDKKRDEVLAFVKTHKLSVLRGDIHAIFPSGS